MFCSKCGVQNEDDALFCTGCGAKINGGINGGQAVKSVAPMAESRNRKKRKTGIIGFVVIAVVVAGVSFYFLDKRNYEKTIEKYMDFLFDADVEAFLDILPEEAFEYVCEEAGYDMEDEIEAMKDGELGNGILYGYFGEDRKVSYEIADVEAIRGDDLKDLQDEYEDVDIEVTAAKTVDVEIIVKSEELELDSSMVIDIIKVDHSWYIDVFSMFESLDLY